MNKPVNDDSSSRVFSKKTNLCFLEALGSLRFLLVRGCPRLGQPIEKPISPRPSGTGIFPYSRMPALKRRPFFKAPLRGALQFGHFGRAKAGEIRKFSLVEIFCWSRKVGTCNDFRKWSHYTFRAVS